MQHLYLYSSSRAITWNKWNDNDSVTWQQSQSYNTKKYFLFVHSKVKFLLRSILPPIFVFGL